jgi:hypothetical protein
MEQGGASGAVQRLGLFLFSNEKHRPRDHARLNRAGIASGFSRVNAYRPGRLDGRRENNGWQHQDRGCVAGGQEYDADAFGANDQAGAAHFIDYGFNEHRSTTFDGLSYIAQYTDLMNAFGANDDAGASPTTLRTALMKDEARASTSRDMNRHTGICRASMPRMVNS